MGAIDQGLGTQKGRRHPLSLFITIFYQHTVTDLAYEKRTLRFLRVFSCNSTSYGAFDLTSRRKIFELLFKST